MFYTLGAHVLGGNLEGFLWDDHGAFQTPEGPLQKVPLSHPMIFTESQSPFVMQVLVQWAAAFWEELALPNHVVVSEIGVPPDHPF